LDLHDARDTRRGSQIDSVGWIFAGVVVIITAIAGIVTIGAAVGYQAVPTTHIMSSR
jgi:hypothetical protein